MRTVPRTSRGAPYHALIIQSRSAGWLAGWLQVTKTMSMMEATEAQVFAMQSMATNAEHLKQIQSALGASPSPRRLVRHRCCNTTAQRCPTLCPPARPRLSHGLQAP